MNKFVSIFKKNISKSYSTLKGSKYGFILQYENFFDKKTDENEMTLEFLKDLKYPFMIHFENEKLKSKSKIFEEFKEKYSQNSNKLKEIQIISQEE